LCLANLLPVRSKGQVGALALPSSPPLTNICLDVRAWQLFNEETVGVNQQQGFACAVPMALTKELLLNDCCSTLLRDPMQLTCPLSWCCRHRGGLRPPSPSPASRTHRLCCGGRLQLCCGNKCRDSDQRTNQSIRNTSHATTNSKALS